jgi:hypothetical protein
MGVIPIFGSGVCFAKKATFGFLKYQILARWKTYISRILENSF